MRYHANRIAQTELDRARMDKQAEEIMADDTIHAVNVVMSSTHPRTDICNLWSKQDKYGLGPGIYPKESAPKPPFHPHCRCVLHSKRLIKTDKAKDNPASERQYLGRVMREEGTAKAAQIIGGRAKLAAALTNAPIDAIVNIHRPAPYRLGRVGDNGGMKNAEMVQSDLNSQAFERFFFNEPGAVTRFQVAALSESETHIFGVESPAMLLSRTTLDEYRKKHPEVGIEDYRRIPEVISRGRVWGGHKLKRYVLLHSGAKAYRAAIKADASGAESWFLSLVVSTKQKPPKGAVLLR